MLIPLPVFFAVVDFGVRGFFCYRVHIAPAPAPCRVVFALFPFGAFLQWDVLLFHLKHLHITSIARYRGFVTSWNYFLLGSHTGCQGVELPHNLWYTFSKAIHMR